MIRCTFANFIVGDDPTETAILNEKNGDFLANFTGCPEYTKEIRMENVMTPLNDFMR